MRLALLSLLPAALGGEPPLRLTHLSPENCSAPLTNRGGFSIFADEPPPPPRPRLTLVQCGDRLPSLAFAAQADWGDAGYAGLAALANLLYARARGFDYVFYLERHSGRPAAFCRVSALLHVLSAQPAPAAALYLDGDAYVRTEQQLSAGQLQARGWRRAMALDEGDESKPGVYHRLRSVPGALSRATPMPAIQAAFERSPQFAEEMQAGHDVLNSGVWLERGGAEAEASLAFLRRWLNTSSSPAGRRWPFEQRTLQALLAASPADRAQTGLLEDVVYNTHASPCVPHLYAGKKRVRANLETLAGVARARLAAAGGEAPDIAPYVVVSTERAGAVTPP